MRRIKNPFIGGSGKPEHRGFKTMKISLETWWK